jgi:hypothetical protein
MKNSSKKLLWIIAGLILVFIAVLAIVFITAADPTVSPQTGGLIRGVDGVTVAAPLGALDHKINIYIERAEDPRAEIPFPGFLEDVKVVGHFYEVTASEEYISEDSDVLLLGLPLPEGVTPENLAVVTLSPPWALITGDDDPSLRWDLLFGAYDANSSLFGVVLPYVGGSPQIFALVEREAYSSEQDNQSAAVRYDSNHESAGPSNWPEVTLLALADPQPLTTSTLVQDSPPTPGIAQLSNSASGLNIPVVTIVPIGFKSGEVTFAHLNSTAAAFTEAYQAYRSLGFREPRLMKAVNVVDFENVSVTYFGYIYQLRKGNHTGQYNCVTMTAYTRYPGHPEAPNDHTTHHELFHAVQYGYSKVLSNAILNISCNYGVIEGTASAAEMSLNFPLVRSQDKPVLGIDRRLFTEALEHGQFSPTRHSYSHQDFWVYIGKRMNPAEPRLSFLIPLFQKGDSLSAVSEWLEEEGTFKSLDDALWQWTKNQAFEKQVWLDANTPGGNPGEWSGHGTISGRVSLSTTSQRYEGGSGDFSVVSDNYFMRYREPKVYEITLKPEAAPYMAKVYTKIEYHGEYYQISPIYPELLYKFYHVPVMNLSYTWNEARENRPHIFRVYDKDVKAYVLVFPQSPGHSFNIKFVADISMLPPAKSLTVRSSGASQASVSAIYVKEEDGSYQTFSGLTNYTLSDIRPNTTVVLKATAPETIPPVVFSHWSGAVQSTNPLDWMYINQDTTVTAHFKRIDPEIIPPPDLTPGPEELSFSLSVLSQGASNVPITSTTGHGGTTSYMKSGLAVVAQVNLQAPEYVGSGSARKRFSSWSGAVSTANRTVNIFMNGNKTVTANYVNDPEEAEKLYNLSVLSEGASNVPITSTSGHGGTTKYDLQLSPRTPVTLTAPKYMGSGKGRMGFSSWSGAVSTTNRTVNIFMTGNRTVTANYVNDPEEAEKLYNLSVLSEGASNVPITSTSGHGGTTNYDLQLSSGTSVTLTAPEYMGSGKGRMGFSSWSGAVSTTNRTVNIFMTGNRTVTANYVNDPEEAEKLYNLSVLSEGVSNVPITSTSGHGGTTNYDLQLSSGTSVTLTAPEYMGSGKGRMGFSHWSGAVSSKNRTANFIMGSASTMVTAHYAAAPEETYYLAVLSEGASGVPISSKTGHGGTTNYNLPAISKGTEAQLTAPGTSGKARFSHWSGAVESEERTITFNMDTNKVVTAHYRLSWVYSFVR